MLDQMFDLSEIWSTDNEMSHLGPTLQSQVNYRSCHWVPHSRPFKKVNSQRKGVLAKIVDFFKTCIMILLHSLLDTDPNSPAVRDFGSFKTES